MARTNECPPYRGFAWDHPLMVHWRKTHPVHPGIAIHELGGATLLRSLIGVLLGGLLLLLGAVNDSPPLIRWIVTRINVFGGLIVGLSFGYYWSKSGTFSHLRFLSGAAEFDEVLWKVMGGLAEFSLDPVDKYVHKRVRELLQDPANWDLCRDSARLWLLAHAKAVLEAERVTREDPLSTACEKKRQHFRSTFKAFEQFGLVSGGHQPFFDEARKELAAKEPEQTQPPSPPSDRYQGGPTL